MAKNKYKGLTPNQAVDLAKEEMKLFQEKWVEVNDTEGYVSKMANEKGTIVQSLLKGEVFAKGLTTLKNLAQAHYERKKPGFFSMLFRTKAAREYRNERKQINTLAKFFMDEEKKDNGMLFVSGKGQSLFSPIYIKGLTQNDKYFTDIANDLETVSMVTRQNLEKKLNVSDVNMQNAKDQILLNFLKEYDSQRQEKTSSTDEPVKEVQENKTEKTEVQNEREIAENIEFTKKLGEKVNTDKTIVKNENIIDENINQKNPEKTADDVVKI